MQGAARGRKKKGAFSMKKAMKKLMAALLAVAMVCAMAIPAFAVKGTETADITGHSFNAYQKDFDKGVDRDSGYIYGPSLPRSWFIGAKVSF